MRAFRLSRNSAERTTACQTETANEAAANAIATTEIVSAEARITMAFVRGALSRVPTSRPLGDPFESGGVRRGQGLSALMSSHWRAGTASAWQIRPSDTGADLRARTDWAAVMTSTTRRLEDVRHEHHDVLLVRSERLRAPDLRLCEGELACVACRRLGLEEQRSLASHDAEVVAELVAPDPVAEQFKPVAGLPAVLRRNAELLPQPLADDHLAGEPSRRDSLRRRTRGSSASSRAAAPRSSRAILRSPPAQAARPSPARDSRAARRASRPRAREGRRGPRCRFGRRIRCKSPGGVVALGPARAASAPPRDRCPKGRASARDVVGGIPSGHWLMLLQPGDDIRGGEPLEVHSARGRYGLGDAAQFVRPVSGAGRVTV